MEHVFKCKQRRIYRLTKALPDIGAHQFLIHLVHVFFDAVKSFRPTHLCVIRRAFLVFFNAFFLVVVNILIVILQII